MKPILYAASTTTFGTNNGLGILSEVAECVVTEERNGQFELYMVYPTEGALYSQIKHRCIIYAKPSPYDDPEPFRIYRITTPIEKNIKIYAKHISYDLSGIPVTPFVANNCAEALVRMRTNVAVTSPFTWWTDKATNGVMTVKVPSSSRELMGDKEQTILGVYGGEFKYQGYIVRLYNSRGANRGVVLHYGKNLIDFKQEENNTKVYTGVYPYYYNQSSDNLMVLPEKIVSVSGTFDFTNVLSLNVTSMIDGDPDATKIRAAANKYISDNNLGVPTISIKVDFVDFSNFSGYEAQAGLEKIYLCDTVTVKLENLGINAQAQVIKTEYNVLLDRYDGLEIGNVRTNVVDSVLKQQGEIKKSAELNNTNLANAVNEMDENLSNAMALMQGELDEAIDDATEQITGQLGGYVVIDSDANGRPYQILIMDTADKETARKVWRWNNAGLGYSANGYNGPYTTAITQNGQVVADFVKTGTLGAVTINGAVANITNIIADNITSGNLKSADQNVVFNLSDGTITLVYPNKYTSGNVLYDTKLAIKDAGLHWYSKPHTSSTWTERGYIDFTYAQLECKFDTVWTGDPNNIQNSAVMSGGLVNAHEIACDSFVFDGYGIGWVNVGGFYVLGSY